VDGLRGVVVLTAATALLIGTILGGALPSALAATGTSAGAAAVASSSHPAPGATTVGYPAVPRPVANDPPRPSMLGPLGTYYMQEGANFLQVAGSASTVFTHLSETFVLPAGSVPTGYELNGVTSTGDWVQLVIGDDWPYVNICPIPTFTLAYELWDSSKNSVSTGLDWWENGLCSQSFTPHLGDTVRLAMDLNCPAGGSGSVCMTYTDLTQGVSAVNIQPQPSFHEHGTVGTFFVNGGSSLVTSNNYFVGPATESIVPVAGSCPTFHQPLVSYVMDSPDNLPITQYSAWSDEFEYFSGFNCAPPVSTTVVAGSDPTTTYSTVSGLSVFGTHIVAGQNWTAAEHLLGGSTPVFEYRFETDPVPLSFSFAVNPSTVDAYQGFEVTSSATAPETCSWTVAGPGPAVFHGLPGSCSWGGYATQTAQNAVAGLVVSADDNVVQHSVPLSVYPDPVVNLHPSVSPTNEYAPVTITTTVVLQPGDRVAGYDWSGLPRGCRGDSNSGILTCTPTATGTFNVSVDVTDSNGYSHGNVTNLTVQNPCGMPGGCFRATFTGPANLPWRALLLTTCKLCPGEARIFPTNGSKAGTVSFLVPNGTYRYVLVGSPDSRILKIAPYGNLTVSGANVSTGVELGKGSTPTLKFSAKGLTKGAPWCVTIGWTTCTLNRTLTLRNLTPGMYPYQLSSPPGFELSASEGGSPIALSGTLDLAAHAAHLLLKFQPSTQTVTFNEAGLPPGGKWCLDIVGAKNDCSTKPTIGLSEPNGTFLYSWTTTEKGYDGGSGAFEVEGAALNRTVLFDSSAGLSPALAGLEASPSASRTHTPTPSPLAVAAGLVFSAAICVGMLGAARAVRKPSPRGRVRRP